MIKTQWSTSADWGCPLDNHPKLVLAQRSKKITEKIKKR